MSLMMSPPQGRASRSLGRHIVARRQAFLCEQFGTPKPSLCHAPPSILVFRLAGKFGHQLAFSGVLQEFFRRVHGDHYSLLFSDAPTPRRHNTDIIDPSKRLLGIAPLEKRDTAQTQQAAGEGKRPVPISPD
jgi:hypothetical protein